MPSAFSTTTINAVLAIGVLCFGVGYAVERFFSGKRKRDDELDKQRTDLIETLTAQLDGQKEINATLKEQIAELQKQHQSIAEEVHHLKGLNEANEKKIQEYLQIISYRNPDLDKTLANISSVVKEVVPFMAEMKQSHAMLRDKIDALQPKRRAKEVHG